MIGCKEQLLMQARHDDPELQRLENDHEYTGGRSDRLVREFR
jgi:hypothetical protein